MNEVLRRRRRIETFAPTIFEKRLAKYEKLRVLLQAGYKVASEVMSNPVLSPEERHALISEAIFNIANFSDEEELYINSDLAAHCVAAFMGAEDVLSIEDPQEREIAEQRVRHMYVEAKRMIREDSGVYEIENLFKKIHKRRLGSPVIDRIKYLRTHPEELDRLKVNEI